MARFKGQYASIVLLGKHNPQILNHDFLVQNRVLPLEAEPFSNLIGAMGRALPPAELPFTEFISTPVVSSIRYGAIQITVDASRFQIADHGYFKDPKGTTIATIARRYFGDLLKYTPFQFCGINFNGQIEFDSTLDEQGFDNRFGINEEAIQAWAKNCIELRVGVHVAFRRKERSVEIQVHKPKELAGKGILNGNFECQISTTAEMIASVDALDELHAEFLEMLSRLEVEVPQ